MTTPAPGSPAELPDAVRARVVALTADVLPDVPQLPPAVRRVAAFAPARRARLGGPAITDALADDELRQRVGTQLAARPEPERSDAAARAARAWLVRPDGWEESFGAALVELVDRPERPGAEAETLREVERLRSRLADAEQSLRETRAAHRAQLEELKADNSALRRKLGDARAAERAARAEADEAREAARAGTAEAEERCAGLEKDNRRLRGQVERLEAEAARVRRDARSDRDEATVRARLLLETVIDAAAGLRRELALPAVEGTPADRVEAALAAAEGGPARPGPTGPRSATALEQVLAMPRARLVIDGYNVSKAAWPSSSLEAQRIRLVNALAPLVARTGAETTVVFDAADTDHRPPVNAPRGVKVLFSPRGVIADDVIRDLVAAEPPGRVVLVVTRDRAIVEDVVRGGARAVDPATLLDVLAT